MERRTFSITFFIIRTKLRKNSEAPVLLRITVNGERTNVSIQRTIKPDHWNSVKGCAKATTQYGRDLNLYLDQVRLQIYQHHQRLLSDSRSHYGISIAFNGDLFSFCK